MLRLGVPLGLSFENVHLTRSFIVVYGPIRNRTNVIFGLLAASAHRGIVFSASGRGPHNDSNEASQGDIEGPGIVR